MCDRYNEPSVGWSSIDSCEKVYRMAETLAVQRAQQDGTQADVESALEDARACVHGNRDDDYDGGI